MPPQENQQPQNVPQQPTTPPIEPQPQAMPQPVVPVAPVVPPKKRIPTWLKVVGIIFAVVIVLVVALFMFVNSATRAPQLVSDQFVNFAQAHNSGAAYELTGGAFRQATTRQQLAVVLDQSGDALQGEEKVTGRTIGKSSGSSSTASIVYEVNGSKGKVYMKVSLQKDDNKWRVTGFQYDQNPLTAN
jgi:hypothetical protein